MSSNNLTQIRDYINSRMSVVESSYSEWTDSLEDIGNIPKSVLDNSYHITLGTISSTTKSDHHIIDEATVLVSIFKQGYNQPTVARDTALQTANCIRLDIINPLNIETYKVANDGNIEDVINNSITPSDIDVTNDNIIKVEIEFLVRLFFATT